MKVQENVSLQALTSMRLGGKARYVIEVTTFDEAQEVVQFASEKALPWFVLGGGSNVIASGDYAGVVILNRITGFAKLKSDKTSETWRVGAGEKTDAVIARFCQLGLAGMEAMSDIPGYLGATPVQNVGAYGQQISDVLAELTVLDTELNQAVTLNAAECQMNYRHSIFKQTKSRRYIILDLTLRLSKLPPEQPEYPSLQAYFAEHQVKAFTPQIIREAVIAVRRTKLPPPQILPSAGSFFKNPIVDQASFAKLISRFPDAPHWPEADGREKLSAGWLIEQAGLKGFAKFGLQVYPENALVITNVSAQTAEDLNRFKAEIIQRVSKKFNVTLEQEPEELLS